MEEEGKGCGERKAEEEFLSTAPDSLKEDARDSRL